MRAVSRQAAAAERVRSAANSAQLLSKDGSSEEDKRFIESNCFPICTSLSLFLSKAHSRLSVKLVITFTTMHQKLCPVHMFTSDFFWLLYLILFFFLFLNVVKDCCLCLKHSVGDSCTCSLRMNFLLRSVDFLP